MQRTIGVLMLVVGIVGIVFSVAGIPIGWRVVDQTAAGLEETLLLVSRSLDAVEANLVQAKTMLEGVNQGLDTVVTTATDAGQVLESIGSLLDGVSETVGEDVPKAIDSVQSTISQVAAAARAVDTTLGALSRISSFLGINVDAATPLEEPVREIGSVLDDLSDDITSLEDDLDTTAGHLETSGEDAQHIAEDLAVLNEDLGGFVALLDEHIAIVRDASSAVHQTQATVGRWRVAVKAGIGFILIWVGLSQVTPLYVGWELMAGRRSGPAPK
jgi:uncharacterized protein YoxC